MQAPQQQAAAPRSRSGGGRGWSLQWRLLGGILALLALIWMAVLYSAYLHVRHDTGELLDAHLQQVGALLAAQDVDEIDSSEFDRIEGAHGDAETRGKSARHKYKAPLVFQVWKDGRLLVASGGAPHTPLCQAPGSRADDDDDDDEDGLSTLYHGRRPVWRVFCTGNSEGDIDVAVAEHIGARKKIVHASVAPLLWSLLLAFPLVALAVWTATWLALRPLRRMGQQIRARSAQSHAPLDTQGMPRDIAPLTDALNHLFARIAEMLDNERRFTADAAHELRTPIAAIRMMAQVAQGERSDEAARQQALEGVLQGCDRASRLMEQLLQLARLESDHSAAPATPHDILPALQQVVADLAHTTAAARAQRIDLQAPAQLHAPMSDALAGVLLRNLLDNALRYSPQGAEVCVKLEQTGAHALRCTVEDSGAGMSQADMARLGERFFRVLGTGASGSGLGWSIVRRIATLYGLHIHADRSPALGGLRVCVQSKA